MTRAGLLEVGTSLFEVDSGGDISVKEVDTKADGVIIVEVADEGDALSDGSTTRKDMVEKVLE
jgi:hypothetical protein